MVLRGSGLVTSGWGLCSLWSYWPCRFAAECEVARMGISTSKSEAMVLSRKKVECLLGVEEFEY